MRDTQVLKAMKRRRVKGARLLLRGEKPAQVARQLGVWQHSVMRWERALAEGGLERIARVGRRGGRFRLSQRQLQELATLLKEGALAAGYDTEIWTLPRVAALIGGRFGERLAISSVWYALQRVGFSPQRPSKPARERNEPLIQEWKPRRWPAIKKSARGRDESSSSSTSRGCPSVPVAHVPERPKAKHPFCNTPSAGSSCR
jgi:transposase